MNRPAIAEVIGVGSLRVIGLRVATMRGIVGRFRVDQPTVVALSDWARHIKELAMGVCVPAQQAGAGGVLFHLLFYLRQDAGGRLFAR